MARFAAILGLVCLAGVALAFPGTAIVSPSLVDEFAKSEKQSIAVLLKIDVSPAYKKIEANGKAYTVRGQKMTDLRQALIEHTTSTQKSLRNFLDSKSVSYKTHWITNRLIIKNASYQLVKELSAHPDVAEIREEVVIQLEKPPVSQHIEGRQDGDDEYIRGVFIVGAPKLWEQGFHGEGVIVSNIDTGVRGTHEALKDNFVGEYGWFDPGTGAQEPYDDQGHGTHTMGTIAGQNRVGVAKGAKWMACLACQPFGCSEEDLLACAEFIACPHDPQGNNPDCSKAPHVTSNSWGSSLGGQTWYDDAIAGFKAAGIIPVFSAGNNGASCQTLGSPGDRDVIGVAATTFNDEIADFSSRGPAVGNLHKPDISAPGVDVLSSWSTGDSDYNIISGTSMACPHVSGGVALLLNAKPELIGDFEGVKNALLSNAYQTNLQGSGQNCGQISDDTFPNHVFGHGRLDLVAAAGTGNATRY